MNGNHYLLDSCFLLKYFAQSQDALDILTHQNILPSQCKISIINRIEVLGFTGLNLVDEQNLKLLISQFEQIPLSEDIAVKTIDIRKQFKIKLPDALILATAKVHNLTLLTFDEKLQKFYHSL